MAEHSHVYFHIIPRMPNQPEDRRGPKVFEYLGASEEERATKEAMNKVAAGVQEALRKLTLQFR